MNTFNMVVSGLLVGMSVCLVLAIRWLCLPSSVQIKAPEEDPEEDPEDDSEVDSWWPLTFGELIEKAYANEVAKGFRDLPKSFGDDIALCHSELSEALEVFRMVGVNGVSSNMPRASKGKPEGVPSELADVVIRIAGMCGFYKIDLEAAIAEKLEYNSRREYRHGNKHL